MQLAKVGAPAKNLKFETFEFTIFQNSFKLVSANNSTFKCGTHMYSVSVTVQHHSSCASQQINAKDILNINFVPVEKDQCNASAMCNVQCAMCKCNV